MENGDMVRLLDVLPHRRIVRKFIAWDPRFRSLFAYSSGRCRHSMSVGPGTQPRRNPEG